MSEASVAARIRFAEAQDAPAVAALLEAMDLHYGEPACAKEAYLACARRTMEEAEGTRFIVAHVDQTAVGLVCLAVVRPGPRLKGMAFLKDIFVTEAARGKGLGSELMRWVGAWAAAEGLGRIDLTTDVGNEAAQKLYRALGGVEQSKVFFRFDPAALANG